MTASEIIAALLDEQILSEASVYLPARGTKWIAVFTGPVPGQQVWRSTGLTDRVEALKVARKWEADAREQRAKAPVPRSGSHQVRRARRGRDADPPSVLTQREVAFLLRLSERAVRNIEKRALAKLRAQLGALWDELQESGSAKEKRLGIMFSSGQLTAAEWMALLRLARTREEIALMNHLLRCAAGS